MFEGLNNRMDRMQEDLSDLRTTVTRVAVTQENTVIPQLKLQAEWHDPLSQRIAELEKAQ